MAVYKIGQTAWVIRKGGIHLKATVIGGTPWDITVELADGTRVNSSKEWIAETCCGRCE